MNLNQLRFACAVAATRSFTEAASLCAVTQPTLSNAVSQLEEELGQKLFVRTTRKVSLTAFGEHLLPDIERVIHAQQALIQRAQAFLTPEKCLIRIGISPLLDVRFLNLLIEPFRSKHPEMEFVFREMNMADLSRMLDMEQTDFLFGVAEDQKEQRESAFLYREPLLYLPRDDGHSASGLRDVVSFEEIADDMFVMVPDACGLTRTVRALFRSHRRSLRQYSGEAMSYQVLEQWAALGIGAAILPQSKISTGAERAVRIRDRTGNDVVLNFEAVWNRSSTKLPHLADFARYIRTVLPALAEGMAPS